MKSFVAALRRLVLPFGATTGQRIVLDGVNGVIEVYDSLGLKFLTMDGNSGFVVFDGSGNLLMSLNAATGFVTYDTNGAIRTQMALPGGLYSFINLFTAMTSEVDGAFVLVQGVGVNPNQSSWMSIGSSDLGVGSLRWKIVSRQNVATSPLIELDSSQLGGTVTARPILNLVGTDFGGTPLQPRTVVHDLWYGEDAGAGVAPTQDMSYGRGAKPTWRFEKTSDTVLSTTAGTFTTIITTGNLALKAGRLYMIMAKPGSQIVTGGSGFAVTDQYLIQVLRAVNGGAFGNMGCRTRSRTNLAVAGFWPLWTTIGTYSPAANANVEFKMEATKAIGAATVTTTVQTDTANGYSELLVIDVGAASGAVH